MVALSSYRPGWTHCWPSWPAGCACPVRPAGCCWATSWRWRPTGRSTWPPASRSRRRPSSSWARSPRCTRRRWCSRRRPPGVVSLDEPVRAQLQEFMVADPGATIEITPRHLLTHTSGIEGDHLIDTGWNADALQRYVATLAGLGQIHPTDETFSFCNTGYGVAGRMLEVATGEHFDRVLRRRLTRPLGCRATLTLPQHALLHSVAVGHVQGPGTDPVRQGRWTLTRSNGPMGGVMAPAGELLAFARMHLAGGRAADGTDLLSPADVEAMQRAARGGPHPRGGPGAGLDRAPLGRRGVPGPGRRHLRPAGLPPGGARPRLALCVLANSPMGGALGQQLITRLAEDLLDAPTGEAGGGAVEVARRGRRGPRGRLRPPAPADHGDRTARRERDAGHRAVRRAPGAGGRRRRAADCGPSTTRAGCSSPPTTRAAWRSWWCSPARPVPPAPASTWGAGCTAGSARRRSGSRAPRRCCPR